MPGFPSGLGQSRRLKLMVPVDIPEGGAHDSGVNWRSTDLGRAMRHAGCQDLNGVRTSDRNFCSTALESAPLEGWQPKVGSAEHRGRCGLLQRGRASMKKNAPRSRVAQAVERSRSVRIGSRTRRCQTRTCLSLQRASLRPLERCHSGLFLVLSMPLKKTVTRRGAGSCGVTASCSSSRTTPNSPAPGWMILR